MSIRFPTSLSASLASSLLVASLSLGCGGKSPPTAPPPPLRPKPIPADAAPPVATGPSDCDPVDASHGLAAKTFNQRSPDEAKKLAASGLAKLQTAEGQGIDPNTRVSMINDAVEDFITALLADPYNVSATYNLAAAYARIERKQCSVNLLTRLLQMRDHASRKAEVEGKIDRLLGRNKTALDPDFGEMRNDQRFRDLISKMCEQSNDPACVFGSQPKH